MVTTKHDFKLTSPAFEDGTLIPARYTCDGEDLSPPLHIEGIPNEARSLALVVEVTDLPMGRWVNWLMWNIPPWIKVIAENEVPPRAVLGTNSAKQLEYEGPCPTSDIHQYQFRLYALDSMLNEPPGIKLADLERVIERHLLAETLLTGLYRRQFENR